MGASNTTILLSSTAAGSVVYFVRIGSHIKIGVTTNLDRRLKAFLTSSPDVRLLLAIPGDRALERRLHESLEDCRIERELFNPEYRVTEFIDHYNYGGFDRAFEFLEATTPAALARKRSDDRGRRIILARQSRAEKDAYFASLVAERKQRTGR